MTKEFAIDILGQRWTVKICKLKKAHGKCYCGKREIHVDPSDGRGMETLMHEVLHAILDVSGMSQLLTEGLEEGIITALENGLVAAHFGYTGDAADFGMGEETLF